MAVDHFLIEAPRVVPKEYADWQSALATYRIYSDAVARCEDWSGAYQQSLKSRAYAAKLLADELEQFARDAFHRALPPKAPEIYLPAP